MKTRLPTAIAGALALVLSLPCLATQVEYDWVNQSGPTDSGSMVFTLASGTPADFSGATLDSFTFTFQGGTVATLGTAGLGVSSLSGTGWSAGTNGNSSTGFLTSVALITNAPHALPDFTFQFQPYAGQSTGVDQATMGTLQSFGVWQENVSTVPLPAGLPLFLSGLAAFGMFRRRCAFRA